MQQNVSSSGPLLLTFTEASRELGVSPDTIRKLISSGKLTAVELNTGSMPPSKRIRRTDLVDYVQGMTSLEKCAYCGQDPKPHSEWEAGAECSVCHGTLSRPPSLGAGVQS